MYNFFLDLVNSDEFDGLIRHGLTTVGGGLIANGFLSAQQWSLISGGVIAALGVIWSVASKKYIKAQAAKEVVNA